MQVFGRLLGAHIQLLLGIGSFDPYCWTCEIQRFNNNMLKVDSIFYASDLLSNWNHVCTELQVKDRLWLCVPIKTAPLNWQFIKPARWFKVEQQLVGPPAKWTSLAWRHSIWYSQVRLLRGNESQSAAPPRRTRPAFSHWYPSVDVKTDVWLSL